MAMMPRIAAVSLSAAVDPVPLAELDQKNMITNDGASFRYEDFSAQGHFRQEADTPDSPRDHEQQNFSGLIAGSTLSFVDAFSMDAATAPRGRDSGPTKSAVSAGVANYEATVRVITNDLPQIGQNLSLSL